MKFRFFLRLCLPAVLLTACVSATSTVSPVQSIDNSPVSLPTPTAAAALTAETLAPTPLPVVTSRGPHLEATDPKSVSMASGGLQFVEFFEFW